MLTAEEHKSDADNRDNQIQTIILRVHELENSWVNQLTKHHFPEYKSLNLGVKGIGNKAAVDQLHFVDQHDLEDAEGIIVFMLSGFERFDVFQERPKDQFWI